MANPLEKYKPFITWSHVFRCFVCIEQKREVGQGPTMRAAYYDYRLKNFGMR